MKKRKNSTLLGGCIEIVILVFAELIAGCCGAVVLIDLLG